MSRSIGGHRSLHFLEQIADGHPVPVHDELVPRQRRRLSPALQFLAMTGGALLAVEGLTAPGLIDGIDAIPHRCRRLCSSEPECAPCHYPSFPASHEFSHTIASPGHFSRSE